MKKTSSSDTFFVAANGNDANAGTENAPFATLARARDAARRCGNLRERRIVVRGGSYFDVSLVLEPCDSGLSIVAAPGESPRLYGGRRVTGWQKDGDCFYCARLPGVTERAWDFRALLVNGGLRPRARLPGAGMFTHASRFDAPWHTTVGGGFRGADELSLKLRLQCLAGDIGPWLDTNNAELTIYHQWDDSVVGLSGYDQVSQTLYFSTPAGYPPGAFNVRNYVVWNIREGMLEPGQWYLDRTRGVVVYWPKAGEDMESIEVVAPSCGVIIELAGSKENPVSDIVLDGLQLGSTTTPLVAGGWAAGSFRGALETSWARNCIFRNLRIAGVGGHAIRMTRGAGNTVTRCAIADVGAGGIYDVQGRENSITHNRVTSFGQYYASAIGIRIACNRRATSAANDNNLVAHNDIAGGPYAGIEFSGDGNRFESNLVRDVMLVLRDGAAFYGAGRGNVISDNVVRDIPAGKHANAYYIDEEGEDCLVENNLSIGCEWPIHMHMATRNTIRHNLLVAAGPLRLSFMRSREFTVAGNVIVAGGEITVDNAAAVASWADNLFFSQSGQYTALPDSERRADPGMVSPQELVYSFREQSPACALGIGSFDFRGAGPAPGLFGQ